MPLFGSAKAPVDVAALTENGGAIGGTSDGNLPSLTATAVALTDSSGGTASDTVADVPAAYAEATIANIVASLARGINRLEADNVALRAAIRENSSKLNALLTSLKDGRVTQM